jgi:hypothetical protein
MDEVVVPLQDWQRLREKAAELDKLQDWLRTLPEPVHYAALHMYVLEAAAQEGKELPSSYQYEGLGTICCPMCGRTESKVYLDTYPPSDHGERLCPDCRTPVCEILQFQWNEDGTTKWEGAWIGSREGTANKVALMHCAEGERKRPYGPLYFAPGTVRHIRLYHAAESVDLTWQEAYDLGWRLLRMAHEAHSHQPWEE